MRSEHFRTSWSLLLLYYYYCYYYYIVIIIYMCVCVTHIYNNIVIYIWYGVMQILKYLYIICMYTCACLCWFVWFGMYLYEYTYALTVLCCRLGHVHVASLWKANGSVVTWGDQDFGGDSSSIASQLRSGVTHVCSTYAAFAATKAGSEV
jgi:hypothetical protein